MMNPTLSRPTTAAAPVPPSVEAMYLASWRLWQALATPSNGEQQMNDEKGKLETWAVLELMGHQRIAGFVREVALGSAAMLRVDVPEIDAIPAFTKFIAPAALYAFTPCTEEVAMAVIKRDRVTPVTLFAMPANRQRALPYSGSDDDAEEFVPPRY
jgi:hypothetical protein